MTHIEQHLKKVIEQAVDGNTAFCVLLESKAKPDRWIQLTWDTINAAYPFPEEPLSKVRKLKLPKYPYLEVSNWETGKFATFEHGADPVDKIAAFVAAYFEKVLGVSAEKKDLRVEEQEV